MRFYLTAAFLNDPDFFSMEESSTQDNVSVEIHLKKMLNEGALYKVSFIVATNDTVHKITVANNDSAMITISYNTLYNVTVVGTADVCGYGGTLSSVISLYYGNRYIKLGTLHVIEKFLG